MKRQSICYFLANMFIYAGIYSVHNFFKEMVGKKNLTLKQLNFLDIFEFIRIPGASLFSFLADKTGRLQEIVIACMLGYSISIVYLFYAPSAIKPEGFTVGMFLLDAVIKLFNCGIFPPLEMLVLHETCRRGHSKRAYGIMRISATMGRALGHLSNFLNTSGSVAFKINVLVFYSLLAVLMLVLSICLEHRPSKDEAGREEKATEVRFLKNIRVILRSRYSAILLIVISQGLHRTSHTSMQASYLSALGIKELQKRGIFMFRIIPEVVFYLMASYMEDLVGCYWMLSLATLAAFLYMVPYLYLPRNLAPDTYATLYAFAEIFKGIFSCFMGYSCAKLTKLLIPEYARVTAQGMYNSSLIGVGSILSGIAGWIMLEKDSGPQAFRLFFMVNMLAGLFGMLLSVFLSLKKRKGHSEAYQ